MLGDYGQVGWDLPPDEPYEGESKFTPEERLYRFRFKMPDASKNPVKKGDPVTHRVLFLNGSPFSYWEHSLYAYKGCSHWTALCLAKNHIDKRGCPLCEGNTGRDWPYYVGLFGIIDLGQVEYKPGTDSVARLHHRTWTDRNGETKEDKFPRVVLAAKKGSDTSPGVLKHLLWEAERKGGDLEGTVWDTTRIGNKDAAVGEKWNYIERISPSDYIQYLDGYGANRDDVIVTSPDVEFSDGDGNGWFSICKPLPFEELQAIVGGRPSGGQQDERRQGGGPRTSGAAYGGSSQLDDDDIPF